jgi:NADP-dependent 3-hydroxy acid dehydrogenase YdfG
MLDPGDVAAAIHFAAMQPAAVHVELIRLGASR